MTCGFINDLRNLVNFTVELKNHKICTLRDSFFKLYIVELGNYRRVICHGDAKFLKKLTGGLKNDIRNFVNFNGSSRKFALWWAPFSVAYKVLAKKMQKRYLSWYWRVIQTLKKNSLFVWKISWEIWWILAWAVENLENCTLMGYFCRKDVNFELKRYSGVGSWKMTYGFKNDIRKLVNFTQVVESNVR